MRGDRHIPPEAQEYLCTLSTRDPEWRQYAAYLFDKGYTLQSVADVANVSRQYVGSVVKRTVADRPSGAPRVVYVRREPAKRQSPPLDKQHRNTLLGLWVLSTRNRWMHDEDSPWSMARDDFLREVELLMHRDYLVSDIASDLGVPVSALYRRISRGRKRGIIG